MFARARSVQFIRYLWIIPVISLLVIVSYFYFDGPAPDDRDMQVRLVSMSVPSLISVVGDKSWCVADCNET